MAAFRAFKGMELAAELLFLLPRKSTAYCLFIEWWRAPLAVKA
jgi:hypothetical protein